MSNLILFTIRSYHRWCANFCPDAPRADTACVAVCGRGSQHELCAAQKPDRPRTFDVHFQFEGTPTNNLEVAFGRDSNTNGVLDVQEIDTVHGWRGGRYFIENVWAWERIGTVAATNALWSPPVAEGDQVGRMSREAVARARALSTSTWRTTRSWSRGVSRPRVAARRRSRSLQHRRPGFSAATGRS